MIFAKIFNDPDVYKPDDFGFYVTKDNVFEHADKVFDPGTEAPPTEDYTKSVTILMYHNIDESAQNGSSDVVTPEKFREVLLALKEAGYTTVSYSDIVDYVYKGTELPDKPVIITFDDGYESNYQYAYPVLKEFGMCATVAVIGFSVGKDTYKDSDLPIIPHFSYEEAKEMYDSGTFDIQSHSYSMHDNKQYEDQIGGDFREGSLKKDDESEQSYAGLFTADYLKSKSEVESNVGNNVFVYTYPFGEWSVLSEVLLRGLGVKVTDTTQTGTNVLVKGLSQSLFLLNRIAVEQSYSGDDVLGILNNLGVKS